MTPPIISETVDGVPVVWIVTWVEYKEGGNTAFIGVFTRIEAAKSHAEGYVGWTIRNNRKKQLFHPTNPWRWEDLSGEEDPAAQTVPGHRILWSYSQDFGQGVFVASEPINSLRNVDGTTTYLE